jgi:hypothetical protein
MKMSLNDVLKIVFICRTEQSVACLGQQVLTPQGMNRSSFVLPKPEELQPFDLQQLLCEALELQDLQEVQSASRRAFSDSTR